MAIGIVEWPEGRERGHSGPQCFSTLMCVGWAIDPRAANVEDLVASVLGEAA